MFSVATPISVPTARHSSRYSPKVAASRQRTSTIGSRNCMPWSNALTMPSDTARRFKPSEAIALLAAVTPFPCGSCRDLLDQLPVLAHDALRRMRGAEIRQRLRRRVGPLALVLEQRLDVAHGLVELAVEAVHRHADVDAGHDRHAPRPGLQEHVRHALEHRGGDQHARAVEPRLDLGQRQEAGELHVRQLRRLVADLLVVARLEALALRGRAADHYEAA